MYRQLLANPNVALMAAADGVTVCCSGTVRFDVDEETCRWIYDNNPVLPRLYSAWNKLVYFRLPIAKIDYYDLRPTPPISQHIDIATGTATNGFVGERFES